jgi:hypothetical protein
MHHESFLRRMQKWNHLYRFTDALFFQLFVLCFWRMCRISANENTDQDYVHLLIIFKSSKQRSFDQS